jgi:recombination protein RecA
VDVEGRIRTELLKTIPGLVWTEDQEKNLKIPRLQIIKSVKGSILTAEKYLDIIIKILINEPGCIVVLDSVAALCSESLWASNMGDSQRMAKIPSLMYEFMRKIAQVVPTMQSNLICITHLQAKLDPYKSQTGMGGNAQEFFASNNLISFSSKEEEDENGYKIGRNTVFKVTKSALGKPGGESTIYIRYGKGCDRLNDLISLGEQLGLIDVNGAWYMYNNEKFQGKKNIYNYLSSNKDISLKLEQEIYNLAFGDTTNESLVSI